MMLNAHLCSYHIFHYIERAVIHYATISTISIVRFIKLFTLILGCQHLIASAHQNSSIADPLATCYLKSFVNVAKDQNATLKAIDHKDTKRKNGLIRPNDIYLSPSDTRAIVFYEIFANSPRYQRAYQHMYDICNPYVWSDLHLFAGTTATPTHHLLSRINKTLTVVGEGALVSLLASPLSNMQSILGRQQVIRLMYEDAQAHGRFTEILNIYKGFEKKLLSFWSQTDPLYSEKYSKRLNELFYTNNAAINKNASSLQMRKIWKRDIWNIYFNFIGRPVLIILGGELLVIPTKCFGSFRTAFDARKLIYRLVTQNIPIWCFYDTYIYHNKYFRPLYLLNGLCTLEGLREYYNGYCNYKEYADMLQYLALRMADVQTFLKTVQSINAAVQNNPHLEELYGQQLASTRTLLARTAESSEMGRLLCYLENLPYHSWSYLFSNAGKLLASYKLFVEHKSIFHDTIYEIGQLDALLSIATLMHATRDINAPHSYTFTKFLPPQKYITPQLALSNMWNPMLDPRIAVGNDVVMDDQSDVQHIILTGPNAGGKSVFLTGIAQSILLSQTFGIAAAKSCEMTPFHRMNTYIDIMDDIAAGKSLFMAEVARFQQHLSILKTLPKQEFSFSIFDEPFSGTNPIEGAAAEYSVLNTIGNYKNSLNIVATHFPTVMLLEQNEPKKGFKNYKVFIKHKQSGKRIEYTYKIVPGQSDQAIAIDILEEQGFSTEMLEQAREIIKHPEKYQKSFVTKKK